MPNILQLCNINKFYETKQEKNQRSTKKDLDGRLDVLSNFNLSIEQGTITAIIGRSGAGKSTLLKLMSLLEQPNSGQITIDGKTVDYNQNSQNQKKIQPKIQEQMFELRRGLIGFVFQNFYLQPELTASENIELPLLIAGVDTQTRRNKSLTILQSLGISDKADQLPQNLSGGQIQRVAIARALINEPKIIFADEPTGNLDDQTTTEVLQIFKDINRHLGTTIVIVTHDMQVASFCDKIYNLNTKMYEK